MDILTYAEASELFGVSLATISRWVKAAKLEEGPKAGKIKTVTKKSVEALSANKAFQIGLRALKNSHQKTNKVTIQEIGEELSELRESVDSLKDLVKKAVSEIEELRNLVQSNAKEIEFMQKFTQNNEKGKGVRKKSNKQK